MLTIESVLKGKRIESFTLDDDRFRITFQTDSGVVGLAVGADCCSETWIESIDDPGALLGTVVSVEDIEMPNQGNVGTKHHPDVESVEYYGLKITTDRGRCVLDYRNSSNGYYGGYMFVEKTP